MISESAGPTRFAGDIPANYDSELGPHLFIDYATDLARRVTAARPVCVLEVAAGTGILTRLLRDALSPSTRLIASDLNEPMLEVARRKFEPVEDVQFRVANATALPFDDAGFDAIVCQFGVMFFADKDRAYREAYRMLSPGGRYHFNVWDSWELNPFARICHETVAAFYAEDPPDFYTVPFGYHRIDTIRASLAAAGFADITAHVLGIEKTIPDVRRFARGLILGNPVIEQIRTREKPEPDVIIDALASALHGAFGEDPGRMPLQAIVLGARKPG
jgi:ubiquinone/menaquinone biosynthesis C-methylase UbiE